MIVSCGYDSGSMLHAASVSVTLMLTSRCGTTPAVESLSELVAGLRDVDAGNELIEPRVDGKDHLVGPLAVY